MNHYTIDQRGQDISFGQAIKDYWRGAFSFSGYTTRKGYWYGMLHTILIETVLVFVILSTGFWYDYTNFLTIISGLGVWSIFLLATIFPNLASAVRRYRDAGMTDGGILLIMFGGWVLGLIPVIGWLISLGLSLFGLFNLCQASNYQLRDTGGSFFYRQRTVEDMRYAHSQYSQGQPNYPNQSADFRYQRVEQVPNQPSPFAGPTSPMSPYYQEQSQVPTALHQQPLSTPVQSSVSPIPPVQAQPSPSMPSQPLPTGVTPPIEVTPPVQSFQPTETVDVVLTREEWIEYFEAINGRYPDDDDFDKALETGEYEDESPTIVFKSLVVPKIEEPSLLSKEDWLDYFESINGRKPTVPEFKAALENGEFEN